MKKSKNKKKEYHNHFLFLLKNNTKIYGLSLISRVF
jgi:hypothetical protein